MKSTEDGLGTQPKRKLKGAIVGFGFISSKGHYPAYLLRDDVEIVAIVDVCEQRRKLALQSGVSRVYDSAQSLLTQERELDFIDIATPPCNHAEIAELALSRGLHVLCEKPLTANLSSAQNLIQSAASHRRVVFPCHNYKHAPVVRAVNEIIDSGEIGRVHGLTLSTFRTTHAKGVAEWKTDWRRSKRYSGGGIAMDHGSHTFYLTFMWLKSLPTSVTAKMHTVDSQWDTEDNFSCVLSFPTGYATAHLSWTAGVRKVIYCVQGALGAITIHDDDVEVSTKLGVPRKFSIASNWGDASHTKWFNSMFDQFLDCIERNDFVNSELKEAYHCIQLIERAYESSRNGCREMSLDTKPGFCI